MVSLLLGRGGHRYFEAGAAILVLVKLGKVLEARARTRSSRAIESLLELAPQTALRVADDGSVSEVPLALLRPGDVLQIRPGERLGVDGTVVEGRSTLDESLLTGESMPVERGPGDAVFGSTVNGAGSLLVRATGVGRDSALGRIVTLVRQAQGTRAPIQAVAGSPETGPQKLWKGKSPSVPSSSPHSVCGSPWMPNTFEPSAPYQGLGVTDQSTRAPMFHHQNSLAQVKPASRSRASS